MPHLGPQQRSGHLVGHRNRLADGADLHPIDRSVLELLDLVQVRIASGSLALRVLWHRDRLDDVDAPNGLT
jgi:hypothetical protein